MKKLLLYMIIGIFLISFVSATQQSLGTFKQGDVGECIELIQTCGNCSYNNLTKVLRTGENPKVFIIDAGMTKDNTYYNYSFCNITEIGTYNVHGFGDPSGEKTIWAYDFIITPTGLSSNLGFYILVVILSLGIIVFGFIAKNSIITLLGSFGLYFLGLYILFNGIVGVKDLVTTWALGIILLGIAMYVSIRSAYSLVTD